MISMSIIHVHRDTPLRNMSIIDVQYLEALVAFSVINVRRYQVILAGFGIYKDFAKNLYCPNFVQRWHGMYLHVCDGRWKKLYKTHDGR